MSLFLPCIAGSLQEAVECEKGETIPSLSQSYIEAFIRQFTQRFSTPQAHLPSVSCVSQQVLQQEINHIKGNMENQGFVNGTIGDLIAFLQNTGLLKRIPITLPAEGGQPVLYELGFHSSNLLSPMELSAGAEPDGIFCLWGALELHDLTNHLPKRYSICTTQEGGNDLQPEHLFTYDTIPYYLHRRHRHSLRGFQQRYVSPQALYSITTFEQTLLDTLLYPEYCGGPEVVYEAWENISTDLDEEEFLRLLSRINSSTLCRRLGAMLDITAHGCTGKLKASLKELANDDGQETCAVPLIKGMSYQRLLSEWNVLIP